MNFDERTQQVAGHSAMIMLGVTQVALGVILAIRLYVFDQPDAQVRDIQIVLFGSILGYFVLRSFIGGVMPVPTLRGAVAIYLAMVTFLFVVLTLWLGWPDLSEWTTNILPVVTGPALVVAGYWTIASLGRRRIEREMEETPG
jgi:hypothetical protein